MENVQTIELEGKKYMIVAELNINGIPYIHFASIDNPGDFCIRKVSIMDGEEMIVGLDSREEFDMALKAFSDKQTKSFEN